VVLDKRKLVHNVGLLSLRQYRTLNNAVKFLVCCAAGIYRSSKTILACRPNVEVWMIDLLLTPNFPDRWRDIRPRKTQKEVDSPIFSTSRGDAIYKSNWNLNGRADGSFFHAEPLIGAEMWVWHHHNCDNSGFLEYYCSVRAYMRWSIHIKYSGFMDRMLVSSA